MRRERETGCNKLDCTIVVLSLTSLGMMYPIESPVPTRGPSPWLLGSGTSTNELNWPAFMVPAMGVTMGVAVGLGVGAGVGGGFRQVPRALLPGAAEQYKPLQQVVAPLTPSVHCECSGTHTQGVLPGDPATVGATDAASSSRCLGLVPECQTQAGCNQRTRVSPFTIMATLLSG